MNQLAPRVAQCTSPTNINTKHRSIVFGKPQKQTSRTEGPFLNQQFDPEFDPSLVSFLVFVFKASENLIYLLNLFLGNRKLLFLMCCLNPEMLHIVFFIGPWKIGHLFGPTGQYFGTDWTVVWTDWTICWTLLFGAPNNWIIFEPCFWGPKQWKVLRALFSGPQQFWLFFGPFVRPRFVCLYVVCLCSWDPEHFVSLTNVFSFWSLFWFSFQGWKSWSLVWYVLWLFFRVSEKVHWTTLRTSWPMFWL